MRPVRLTVSGFTCFRELQTIEFAELDLFAIQGPTGAGKSSLLDAMTYALYGQTSRLGSRGLEALVSQGASGMLVTLEFEASGGQVYRVSRVWSTRQSEKQLRFDRHDGGGRWSSATDANKVRDVADAIQTVVGLDFEGFTRAVLLPQGEFDRFLRGDANQRRELLKGLLNVHQIERMRERAAELARDLKASLENKRMLLDGEYANATPEAAETLRLELETAGAELLTASARTTELAGRLEAARDVARLSDELDAVRRQIEALKSQADAIASGARRAADARRAAAIVPRMEAASRGVAARDSASVEHARRTAALEAAVAQSAVAQDQMNAALAAAARLPELEARLQEAAAARPKMDRLRSLGGRLDLEHDDPVTFSESAAAELEVLAARVPAYRRALADRNDLDRDAKTAAAALKTAHESGSSCARRLEQLKVSGLSAKGAVEDLERDLVTAQRDEGAGALVGGLRPGDPCPFCARPLQDVPDFGPSRVPELTRTLADARESLERLRSDYGTVQSEVRGHEKDASSAEAEIARVTRQAAKLDAELTEHRAALAAIGDDLDPARALEARRTRLLAGLALEIRAATGGAEPEGIVRDLTAARRRLSADQERAREAFEATRTAVAETRAAADAAASSLAARATEADERLAELDDTLREAGFTDDAAARLAALAETEILRLERAAREHSESVETARAGETKTLESLAGRDHDPKLLLSMESEHRAFSARTTELAAARGRLEGALADLGRRIETARELRREGAELGKRYDVYQQLALDLRGNEFQEFMLAQVQRELLSRATSIMREVTGGRYALDLIDGEYAVRDDWNAGEPRGIRTLSGGESFIASLAMALALSDYLAGHKALGALFLDEGFGTLDPEALDAVATVLETLQTRGRMVGVITHVSSLAERLPVRIVVEKGPATSTVRIDA